MKRLIALMMGVLMICSFVIPVWAEEGIYETAGDWYRACYEDLPDYICGVWSRNGASYDLIVGIRDDENWQTEKEEILSLIRDDTTIRFFRQTYSRSYLLQVRDEIADIYGGRAGLFFVGIDDEYNLVRLEFDSAQKDSALTEKTIEDISARYGDAVGIEYRPLRGEGLIIGEPYQPLFLDDPNGGVFETAGDWVNEYSKRLPDYICGYWSTDGTSWNLTFGILDTEEGNAGMQEMLFLIEDDSTVSFVYQKYSKNYLLQVKEEICEYFFMDNGLQSVGVDVSENCVSVAFEESYANNETTQGFISELLSRYGDAVNISFEGKIGGNSAPVEPPPPITQDPPKVDPPITPNPPITQDPPADDLPIAQPDMGGPDDIVQGEQGQSEMVPHHQTDVIATDMSNPANNLGVAVVVAAMVCVYMMSVAVMSVRKKKMLVLRETDFGTTVVEAYPVSVGSVKKMVRESNAPIPEGLDDRVMEAINAIDTHRD